MLTELLPFAIPFNSAAIAGIALWSLALYLAFSPLSDWVTMQLNRWFNFAERSLYFSEQAFERDRQGRESQNAFLASLLSPLPFVGAGALFQYGVQLGLDQSWSLSLAMIAVMGSAIYELGRRDSQRSDLP
jgi:hypothetical protein